MSATVRKYQRYCAERESGRASRVPRHHAASGIWSRPFDAPGGDGAYERSPRSGWASKPEREAGVGPPRQAMGSGVR